MQFKSWGVLSLVIIAVSIFYYLVIFLPEKEKARIELEKSRVTIERVTQERLINETKEKENKLEICFANAFEAYTKSWNLQCKDHGQTPTPGCNLPWNISSLLDKEFNKERELCIKKWK